MASRPNLRSAAAAGLIALALVGTGCSTSSDPETWADADESGKVEENFLRTCTEADAGKSDAADLAAYCGCAYDGLRQAYADDYEGFLSVNRDLGNDPSVIPPNVEKIFDDCIAAHLAS